jgi:hypothetical protein
MLATNPLVRTSRAISAVLQRDRGTPLVAGNSHASALTCTTTSGGENRGTPRSIPITQTGQPFIEETLAPEGDDLAPRIQTFGDFTVGDALGSKENDLCALHLKIR